MRHKRGKFIKGVGNLLAVIWIAAAQIVLATDDVDLVELSLEALMDIEVTSVSKKAQKLSQAGAAIYVLTSEDIRRSGARSIPEALRLVPGLHVAQVDSYRWAITARGANSLFANKLLMLIDGRSVYTPLFSGVYWDVQDTMLSDVDRIEVIRGPGASLWGANAVNGVINVITKSAKDTLGGLVSAGGGDEEQGFGTMRYGAELSPDSQLRGFVKYINRDDSRAEMGGPSGDQWESVRGGFRLDSDLSDKDTLTVQGDVYSNRSDYTSSLSTLSPPFTQSIDERADQSGGNIMARWGRSISDTSDVSLQLYYDRVMRDEPILDQARNTYDVDFQHRFELFENDEIIWGVGYRSVDDNLKQRVQALSFNSNTQRDNLFSAFVQNELQLLDQRMTVIVGTKLEHNDYSGFEVQPNARVIYALTDDSSVWAAFSRAVRTPSRADEDIALILAIFPNPDGSLVQTSVVGSSAYDSNELLAYEAGYRQSITPEVSVDISTFYNDLNDDTDFIQLPPSFSVVNGTSVVTSALEFTNGLSVDSYGVELALEAKPVKWLRMRAGYWYIQVDDDASSLAALIPSGGQGDPPNQAFMRAALDLPHDVELDVIVRYVDSIQAYGIDGNTDVDLRLAWKALKQLELAFIGKQLFHDSQREYEAAFIGLPVSQIERSLFGQVTWWFD